MENNMKLNLDQFTGTENYWRFNALFPNVLLTDGTHYLAQEGECYWLFEAIASHQPRLLRHCDARLHDLQFWTLKKNADNSANLICVADSDCTPVVTQKIPYTDFPLDEIKLFVGRDHLGASVIYLPSEH
jgi:hypothetical protein